MERAYRRRELILYPVFAMALLLIMVTAHYAQSIKFYLLIPLVFPGALVLSIGPARLFFPHAWRTFDAPRPSPALEEEARALAHSMGVRFGRLRVTPRHSKWPSVEWRGWGMVANTALRDLPPAERRFALAQAIALKPNGFQLFVKYAAQPLIYVAFTAWCWDLRLLAMAIGTVVFGVLCFGCLNVARWRRVARQRAVDATGVEAALAYWRHLQGLGSTQAASEIAALTPSGLTPGS